MSMKFSHAISKAVLTHRLASNSEDGFPGLPGRLPSRECYCTAEGGDKSFGA
jgi:hypothetical protein